MGKINFLSGLPRSGSSLLASILNQNPRFYATPTSGLLELVLSTKARFWSISEFEGMDLEKADKKVIQVIKGLMQGYYSDVEKHVIFDKYRCWESHCEMLCEVLGERPKIICCVRDVREVLASMEKLTRKSCGSRHLPQDKFTPIKTKTTASRCHLWMAPEGVVGAPIGSMADAVTRGFRDCLHIVEYNQLCTNPKQTLSNIYSFLGEHEYTHDFEKVVQLEPDENIDFGFKDLHAVREKITLEDPTWPKIIGAETGSVFQGAATFWKNFDKK